LMEESSVAPSINYPAHLCTPYPVGVCGHAPLFSQTLHHCNKIPDINNLREEWSILAHTFRDFGSWSLALLLLDLWWSTASWRWKCVTEERCSLHGGQEVEGEKGTTDQV
jgi:hypothetical protein